MCFSSLLQFCPVKYTHSFVSCIWLCYVRIQKYGQTSSICRTLVGNEIADHSDVVGASPVGAAPTKSSFST